MRSLSIILPSATLTTAACVSQAEVSIPERYSAGASFEVAKSECKTMDSGREGNSQPLKVHSGSGVIWSMAIVPEEKVKTIG